MNTRPRLMGLLVTLLLSAGAIAGPPPRERAVSIDIASQPIEEALNEFGRQVNLHVVWYSEVARGVNSRSVFGKLTPQEALGRLLKGSGLQYEYLDAKTVAIMPRSAGREEPTAGIPVENEWLEMRLAQAGESEPSKDQPSEQRDDPKQEAIGEIVVTAQKRGNEQLQDVPIPVAVLSATALLERGATGLQDYFSKVPGLSLTSNPGGMNAVVIRGVSINGGNDNPTVGLTVNDAPYGASTFLGGGLQPIDLDPNELTQIEVLRGPQGTLYGASSIGGLLKYVMADPLLDEFSGRAMMSTQSAHNNDGLDYALRGSINIPINSRLALRVSGFDRSEAGYIDDSFGGKTGINGGHSYGGRAALLWRANEDWSVNLSAVRQLLRTDNANVVDLDPSEEERLESSDYIPNGTGWDRSVTFLTGTIAGRISEIDLTSISAYTRSSSLAREGFTRGLFHFFSQLAEPSADSGIYSDDLDVSKFSQEVRANIPIGSKVDWLVGAFYTKEKGDLLEEISSSLRTTGEVLSSMNVFWTSSTLNYTEIAAFTNLTVRFTDRFDVQFGGRLSENRQSYLDARGGFLLGGGPFLLGPVRSKDDPFTYLITPRLKLTDDWMVYSRIASGYRPGGPTFNSQVTGGPPSLKADTTENYELGVKGQLFDRRLSVDASAYYIDWKDIPVGIRPNPSSPIGYLVNAAGAISKGLELSFDLRPFQGLTLSAWGAWGDAYIDKLPPNATVPFAVDDRLPFSPRFSGNASIDYERPLFETMSGNIGASMRYVGDRLYSTGSPDNVLSAYTQVDVYAGLRAGTWTVNAFVNNLTDERGRIGLKSLADAPPAPTSVLIIRPRTIGLSVAKDF